MSAFQNKTILSTGGTGFLGSHLIGQLVKTNNTIIVLKRSTSKLFRLATFMENVIFYDLDVTPLQDIFDNHQIDMIIHCATTYGRQLQAVTALIDSNLVLPLELLQLCTIYKINPIFINTDTILDRRVSAYSLAKKQLLEWFELFSVHMPCINISLEHFYGPLDNRSKFCTKIIMDLLNGVDSIELTPGLQKRDFIYIEDVVDAFLRILDHSIHLKNGFYQFEVGTGKNISIKSFVELIKKLTKNTNTKLNFGAINYRPNEIMEYSVNLLPLQSLGWQPRYTLEMGLNHTIAIEKKYYKEQNNCVI